MDEKPRSEKLKDVFGKYKGIWRDIYFLFVIGLVTYLFGFFFGSNYVSFFGIALLMGSFIGIFFGIYLGLTLGWIVPFVINLFLGVYLAFLLFGTPEAVFASYITPAIGGLVGWYSSKKRIFIDKGIEAEYYKDKGTLFSNNE